MAGKWTTEKIMDITSGYRGACVLFAAADLDIFSILDGAPATAQAVAAKLGADERATASSILDICSTSAAHPAPGQLLFFERLMRLVQLCSICRR